MPDWTYKALLIGNARFTRDPDRLESLHGPPNDVGELGLALTHTDLGLHLKPNVTPLVDRPYGELREAIATFFGAGRDGEQLLLYYSGHGRRTLRGELCICAENTVTYDDHMLQATTVGAQFLAEQMRASNATAKIIVLDCCHSGAFDHRFKGSGELPHYLQGEGQFGLYSTHVLEKGLDAPSQNAMSPFTECLVEALRLGTLDRDRDGFVDLEDIYSFVLNGLRFRRISTPTRSMPGPTVGTVALARSRYQRPVEDNDTELPASAGDPTVLAEGWRLPPSLILPVGPPPLAPVPPSAPMFYMAGSLVTNRQFAQFLAEDGNAGWRPGGEHAAELADRYYLRHWSGGRFPANLSEHPVVNISPLAAHAYVQWAARRWGVGLRLPFHGEWATACRAGRAGDDYIDDDIADGLVDYNRTDRRLTAVDALPPNRYGISNLLGNAAEICLPDGTTEPGVSIDARGGASHTPRHRLSEPIPLRPGETRDDVGFRCVQPADRGLFPGREAT